MASSVDENDLIAMLRADFATVAGFRAATGEWSKEEEAEFGLAIKAVIDAKDWEMLALWAAWFDGQAAVITDPTIGVEDRIRARILAEQQAAERIAA